MYSITVKDRCAYALSLKLGNAPLFRTGVTALVDAKLSGPELGPDGLLIDFVAVQLALLEVIRLSPSPRLTTPLMTTVPPRTTASLRAVQLPGVRAMASTLPARLTSRLTTS